MSNLYVARIESSETLTFNSDTYMVYAANNNITITLPDISESGDGPNFIISRIDNNSNNTVTIDPNGVTLNGNSSTGQLNVHENVRLVVHNGGWYTIIGKWL